MNDVLSQEPSLSTLWLVYGLLAFCGFLLCRYRAWALYVVLPAVLGLCFPLLIELHDPVVGPAIRRASLAYYLEAHALVALALLLPFLGSLRRAQESKERPTSSPPSEPG